MDKNDNQPKRVAGLLISRPFFGRWQAWLTAGTLGLVGLYVVFRVVTTSTSQLYLTPASSSVLNGSTMTVAVRMNSGADTVNAVQANLLYNAAQLQYISMDYIGSAFTLQAVSSGGAGSVKIARATSGGGEPTKGNQLVANVKFKVLTAGVSSTISFASSSVVIRSTDNANILTQSKPGVYRLVSPT